MCSSAPRGRDCLIRSPQRWVGEPSIEVLCSSRLTLFGRRGLAGVMVELFQLWVLAGQKRGLESAFEEMISSLNFHGPLFA